MNVASIHRRPRLADLSVEDHPNRPRIVVHREHERVVADERTDDVSVPTASVVAISRPAPKANPRGIDSFLPERAESFALYAGAAVLHVPLQIEQLQAIVERAHEHHAAHDLELLVVSQ